MTNLILRKLTIEDASELMHFRKTSVEKAPLSIDIHSDEEHGGLDYYESWIEKSLLFGHFNQDRLISLICISFTKSRNHAHKAYISSLFVEGDYRSRGLAKTLFETCINNRLPHIEQITTDVMMPNDNMDKLLVSLKFIKRAVFKDVWKQDNHYYDCAFYVLNMSDL